MDIKDIKKKLEDLKKSQGRGKPKKEIAEIEHDLEALEAEGVTEIELENPTPIEADVQPAPVERPTSDRAEFDCVPCHGEGITIPAHKPQGLVCTVCHGTGKN